jgi:hypothetical protein
MIMLEKEWRKCKDPERMLKFLSGIASERKLRLFACNCCRRVWSELPKPSQKAVIVAERYAEGGATRKELAKARVDAEKAADNAKSEMEEEFDEMDDFPEIGSIECIDGPSFATEENFGVSEACVCADRTRYDSGQVAILRDLFGSPFHAVDCDSTWQTRSVMSITRAIAEEQAFDRVPILADALEEAGCSSAEILDHLRTQNDHFRGCWVVDLLLGRK